MTKTAHSPVNNLARVHERGLLLSILEREILLTRIKLLNNGCFVTETKDWDSYWQPLYELGHTKVEENLNALYSAWRGYIQSGFDSILRQDFCFRYFSLLNVLFSVYSESEATPWLNALHTALGFECFGVTSSASDPEVLDAGTCTMRNPCYLLAKLRMPNVLDAPQFLPVITVTDTNKPELFYHYRQYTLSKDSSASLLFYPAVSEEKRSASFRLLNTLAGGIRYGADPWTSERAEQIFKGVVHKIIQAAKSIGVSIFPLEFVDVGAGSGSLTSRLCQHIQKSCSSTGDLQFRLWSIDLEPADPSRFFRTKTLRGLVDSLVYLGDDYRNWLSRPQPLPSTNGLRITLISKLFDVFSRFSIVCLSCEDKSKALSSSEVELCDPSICLASGSIGAQGLSISNSRPVLQEGKTYAQASLTNFYRGLFLLSMPVDPAKPPPKGLFLPVRVFNSECLVTLDGYSVISVLAENCNYIIIEDADLSPQDLIDHATKFSLGAVTVYDMTKTLKLKGNYLYLITLKKEMSLPLPSEQIW